MLKILRRNRIEIQKISQELQSLKVKMNPRYMRTVLQFDGSMTKFVMNMSGEGSKPLIKIIQQSKIELEDTSEQKEETVGGQSLFDLKNVFIREKALNVKVEGASSNLIERSIGFFINKEKSSQQPKLLYFARSFWDEQKYDLIMSKSRQKPIGLNLIDQQVQIFRKINWTGFVDLQVFFSLSQKQPEIHQNLCSRSYSMISKGDPLCELEEFFLPEMFDIFKENI